MDLKGGKLEQLHKTLFNYTEPYMNINGAQNII